MGPPSRQPHGRLYVEQEKDGKSRFRHNTLAQDNSIAREPIELILDLGKGQQHAKPDKAVMAISKPEVNLLALSDSGNTCDSSTAQDSSRLASSASSFFKSAKWTADGTTLITSSYDNRVGIFLVPENLLDDRDQPLTLRPQKILQLAESTNIVASSPYFDVRFPNTDHLLVASRDHPLQLFQALPPPAPLDEDGHLTTGGDGRSSPIASYRLISPTTEAYLPVHSVVWPSPGTHFFVGTRDLIAQFDITRNGDGPLACVPTIPSRRHIRKGNGVGMRGTISALSAQTTSESAYTGLVAAGTWTRSVGLYDFARGGECVSTWNVREAASSAVMTDPPRASGVPHSSTSYVSQGAAMGIGGAGINQTIWSPCGRYLLINERQSTGMLIYDVRVTNQVLGFLAGRNALTHQRLDCDVFRGLDTVGGFEVWAGTWNGAVKVWEGVGNTEGCQWPSWDFLAGDTGSNEDVAAASVLGSVALHHSGSVVATCSGCWTVPDVDDAYETDSDASSSSGSADIPDRHSSSDASCASSRSFPVHSTLQSGRRKTGTSTLKIWGIGSTTQVDETNHTYGNRALKTET